MITVLSSVAFASSARASKYLSAYHATMFETSDGNIGIYFNVIAPRKMEHLGTPDPTGGQSTIIHTQKLQNCRVKM